MIVTIQKPFVSTLTTGGLYLITSMTSLAVPPICLNFSLIGFTWMLSRGRNISGSARYQQEKITNQFSMQHTNQFSCMWKFACPVHSVGGFLLVTISLNIKKKPCKMCLIFLSFQFVYLLKIKMMTKNILKLSTVNKNDRNLRESWHLKFFLRNPIP